MGAKLKAMAERVRQARGPWFMARVQLELNFDPNKQLVPDSEENIRKMKEVVRSKNCFVFDDEQEEATKP